MTKLNDDLAARTRAVLAEHNQTFRGQRTRTGLSHVTVLNMANGITPQMDSVVAFARGFGLDVNEWLTLAGYEAMPEQELTGSQILDAGLKALRREFDRPIPMSFDEEKKAILTPEEAFRTLAFYRLEVEADRM